MLLCKCMNSDCENTHWSDLSPEDKAKIMGGREDTAERSADKEDKSWPPKTMETK